MFDLAVVNGDVVMADGVRPVDIGISGGVISALARRGEIGPATESIDASGRVVVPGAIDPHIHANLPEGAHRDDVLTRDEITLAALYGGTTTVLDFVWPSTDDNGDSLFDVADRAVADWEGSSFTDFSFHVVLRGGITDAVLTALPRLIDRGYPSFKVFTTDIFPRPQGGHGPKISFGTMEDLFQALANRGAVVNVHAEDDDIVMHRYDRHLSGGRTGVEYMPDVHTTISEDISFRRVLRLAEHYPGINLYFHHVTARFGVEALAEFRLKGVCAYGEAIPVMALHTAERYKEPEGFKYHIYPSLKWQEDVESLWTGIADGTIQTFGTDGTCPKWSARARGCRIDDAFGGVTGVEPKLAVIYTELVDVRRLGLKRFVETVSENAARIFGLYPRKGAIAVGSDADLVVIDPTERRTIHADDMHEGDFTPWEGWEVTAWPSHTILGGRLMVADGVLTDDQPRGQFLPRGAPSLPVGQPF
jgi:dihydropyrimidinase